MNTETNEKGSDTMNYFEASKARLAKAETERRIAGVWWVLDMAMRDTKARYDYAAWIARVEKGWN
jgi:hypothetical protein